jgi:hypothetical protein
MLQLEQGIMAVDLSGVFAKFQKATITFVMSVRLSVCLSVRTEQLGSHLTDFREILYSKIYLKPVDEIQVNITI